jgi:adenylyltransferase/sulfurtransferase
MSVASLASERSRRQRLLAWLDDAAQERIEQSAVLVTRVGGLGGPLAQSLAMAGVGRIVFFHEGILLEEDLNRMMLMDADRLGAPRAPQAAATLRRFARPGADVLGFDRRVTPDEATAWMRSCDLAIGAAPTYEERLILNDAAAAAGKPYVDAAMYGDEGHVFCADSRRSSCLRCLVPKAPPWRDDFPVLGAVSAATGSLAAVLAIRILAGVPIPWGELMHVDFAGPALTRARVPRRSGCPACAACPIHFEERPA